MSSKGNLAVSVATPFDATDISKQDLVTPTTTGRKIKVPGRKKLIRGSISKVPKKLAHPSYKQMVDLALIELDSRKGVTRPAIKNYIMKNFNVGTGMKKINLYIHKTIDKLVEKNELVIIKGESHADATARYRLAPNSDKKKKKTKHTKKSTSLAVTSKKLAKKSATPSRKAPTSSKKSTKPAKKSSTPVKKAKSAKSAKESAKSVAAKKAGEVKKRKIPAKADLIAKKSKKTPTSKATKVNKVDDQKKAPKKRRITKPQTTNQNNKDDKLKKALTSLSPAAATSKYQLRKKDGPKKVK